ncbi:MAG: hypothetical protein KAU03_03160 [Candidatus Altiarchaeales archaeon]|nr:hypothetical protein [Candidatus Altiarchaeales archaeon]
MNNKRLKLCLIAGSRDGTQLDGARFNFLVGRRLQGYGFDICYVTFSQEIHDYFSRKNEECIYIPEKKEDYTVNNLEKELRGVEEKYECIVEEIFVGDYDYYHSPNREKSLDVMVKIFRFWEDYLEKEKPNYIIGGGQRFIHMIPYTVCKKRDTKFLVLSTTPFPETFCFSENILGHISTLDKYWELNKGKELTNEEIKEVEEYVKSITETKERPFQIDSTPYVNPAKLRFFLERAYKSFFTERLRTPYSQPWRGAYKYALKIIRSELSKILYSKPDYNEKYIFFPLHVEWDSVMLVWNPLFINQVFLIKILSRSLPSDVTLYVKEHPNDVGGTPLTQLKRIKDTPKVKLIHPQEDSHEIIKNSRSVLVIAGTPGWEGLLMGKTVINVGRTYYEISGLTWGVKDITQLSDIIKKAIKENKENRKTLHRFIAAFQKVTYPGRIYFTQLYYSNEINRDLVLSEENIKNVAAGIKKQLTDDLYLLED